MTTASTRATAAVGVAAAAALALAACSSSSSSSGSGGAAGGGSTAGSGGGSTKIVYIPGLTGNPFYNTVACGAQTAATKLGVGFTYQGASTFSVAEQTKIVNAVVATKPSAIMISITDPTAMAAPLTVAKNQGIKIIGIDGDLNDKSIMTTNIQADGSKAAALAADALGQAVGGKGSVLIIDNATGSVVSKARTDGFTQELNAKYPNMKILPIQYSANDVSKAASFASTAATSNADLVGVFGAETNNTQGALTGIRESNKKDQVKIVGFDTSDPIVAALKDGSLLGTVVQNPRGEGQLGVQSAVDALAGKSVPRDQTADALFVTPDTVNSDAAKQYIYDVNCKS